MRPSQPAFATFSVDELRARPGVKWHRYGDDVLPAWIAEMDFGVAEPIQSVLRRIVDDGAYGYEPNTRSPALRAAFGEHMQRRFGWQPDCDQVVPVADLVQALFTLVSAFTEPGQGVVVQTPIYPPFQNSIRETGRRIVEHRLIDDGTRFKIDVASIGDAFDADAPLLLLCNPHNPTGRVFARDELEAIAEVARSRKLVVVADEVHAELAYAGAQHIPFATLAPERTITITSATKAYNIPGLRCGVIHFGSSALREQFRSRVPDRMLGIVNQFGMAATLVAWLECDGWLADVLRVLEDNRERLGQFLASELPEVGYYPPEATYLAWLDFGRLGLPSAPQPYLLEHARVALSDGSEFGPPGQTCARLNFGTTPAILDEVLARLARAVRRKPR